MLNINGVMTIIGRQGACRNVRTRGSRLSINNSYRSSIKWWLRGDKLSLPRDILWDLRFVSMALWYRFSIQMAVRCPVNGSRRIPAAFRWQQTSYLQIVPWEGTRRWGFTTFVFYAKTTLRAVIEMWNNLWRLASTTLVLLGRTANCWRKVRVEVQRDRYCSRLRRVANYKSDTPSAQNKVFFKTFESRRTRSWMSRTHSPSP